MNPPTFDQSLDLELARTARLLQDAERILIITGAGISADSGLPTYRGIGGLYNDTETDDGVPIEVALSSEMLQARPDITWKYLAQIEATCRGARPNVAHEAIAALESSKDVTVLTQNIDGLHRAAGSQNVIEIHGTVHQLFCTRCNYETSVKDYASLQLPPTCPECKAPVRPNVVLFGEALPAGAIPKLMNCLESGLDAIISIGTTSVFPYIAEPVAFGQRHGIPTVEINPGESRVSHLVDIKISIGAAAAFQFIRHWQSRT